MPLPTISDVRTIKFQDFGDERGGLIVVEGSSDCDAAAAPLEDNSTPFEIKRVFYMYGSDDEIVRGQHANRVTDFVLINVSGTSKVKIIDGYQKSCIIELREPNYGVFIPHMLWKEMYDFSKDSVLLVLASTHYDGSEYIRDYDNFISESAQSGGE